LRLQAESFPMSRRRKTRSNPRHVFWRRFLWIAFGILLGLGFVELVLLVWADRKLALAVRDAGDARLRLADFAKRPPAKKDNASTYLKAASALVDIRHEEIQRLRELGGSLVQVGRSPAEEDRAMLEAIVRRNQITYQILDAAMDCSEAWYHADESLSSPMSFHSPLFSDRQKLAYAIRARALAAAHAGRFDEAYDACRQGFRYSAWSIEENPTLVSGLIGIALGSVGLDTLQALLELGDPAEEARKQLGKELERLRRKDPLAVGLEGERAFHFEMYENALGGNRANVLSAEVPLGGFALRYPLRFLVRANQALALQRMTRLIEQSRVPTYQLDQNPPSADASDSIPFYGVMVRSTLPDQRQANLRRDRFYATIDLGRLALALGEYRAGRGDYPDSLDVLVPEFLPVLRVDPLSGLPYRYRREAPGFVLYALSVNGQDDGGTPSLGRLWKETGDLVWKAGR